MNQDDVFQLANSLFASNPDILQRARDNIMYILWAPDDLRQILDHKLEQFRARIWFESLLENSNAVYAEQVNAALAQPGSCVVVVGEQVAENQVKWRGAGCYLFA